MLGEEKIIVQDRGIDAGIAALMQNANKGNMDPAALMAMMNNNYGFGGNELGGFGLSSCSSAGVDLVVMDSVEALAMPVDLLLN